MTWWYWPIVFFLVGALLPLLGRLIYICHRR